MTSLTLVPRTNNPLYPLPADYFELSPEGQRQARVNACRQWLGHPHDVEARGDAFVAALNFFDAYYLMPDKSLDWDPMFYDFDPLPTPWFQLQIDRASIMHRAVAAVAPRGAGKTMRRAVRMMLQLVSRPKWSYVYCTSEQGLANAVSERIKDQLYNNPRIQEDWGPEYGVSSLEPARGEKSKGKEHFILQNGAWLATRSATGRQRGLRPIRYLLDDPEYDRRASTSPEAIRDWMETTLFRVILPMVMRAETGVDWIGTFVSKRHFLWQAMETREVQTGQGMAEVAADERFNSWCRLVMPAAVEEGGVVQSCWPEMWPVDEEQKTRLVQAGRCHKDTPTLEQIRQDIGESAFQSEYMAKDGGVDSAYFPELTEEKHGWWFDKSTVDEYTDMMPWLSNTRLCYLQDGKEKRWPLKKLLSECPVFITCDIAWTGNAGSDRNVAMCQCLTPDNELLVLDLWSEQVGPGVLPIEAMRMADRWHAGSIHPEKIRGGNITATELEQIVATRATEVAGVTHLPLVRPFNPGLLDKTSKIAAIRWRFEHGKVKLPLAKAKFAGGAWGRLLLQAGDFNPSQPDGGLAKDDELDTLAMHQFVVKGLPTPGQNEPKKESLEEKYLALWREGNRTDPETGFPLWPFVQNLLLPDEVASAMMPHTQVPKQTHLEVG